MITPVALALLFTLAPDPAPRRLAPDAVAVAPTLRGAIDAFTLLAKDEDLGWMSGSGLALDRPAWAFVSGGEAIASLGIADAAALDAAFDRLIAARRAKALAERSGDRAVELVTKRGRLILDRTKDRLFVARSAEAIAIGRAFAAPSLDPPASIAKEKRAPALWFSGRPPEAVERLEGAVFLSGKTLELRAEALLDFATALLAGELAAAPRRSRTLIEGLDVVADATGFAGGATIANLFDLERIPIEHAKTASGYFQVQLTRGGAIVASIEAREGVEAAELEALRAAIAARYDFAEVSIVKPRTVVAIVKGKDKKALAPAAAKSGEERAQLELRVKPASLLEGLEGRTKSKKGPRLLRPELAIAKSRGGVLFDRIAEARAELSFGPGTIGLRAVLEAR